MKLTNFSLFVALLILGANCGSHKQSDSIARNKVIDSLTETGELQAVNSKIITVPFYGWEHGKAKLMWLAEEGEKVLKGDCIAILDTSSIKRGSLQKQADLSIALTDLRKLQVENNSKLKELEAELESAKAALKQAQIDTQRVKYESAAEKEVSRLKLKIAEIDVEKANKKIEHTKIIQQQSLKIQNERIRQIRNSIENAERSIRKFTLTAPAEGIVEYRRKGWDGRGKKIQVGDEFWPGRPLVGLPDLNRMKAVTSINETDITKVKVGQKAVIRLDAYPKETFEGEISYISITCRDKDEDSKLKVFDVEILINGTANILKPGMTVSCEIFVENT